MPTHGMVSLMRINQHALRALREAHGLSMSELARMTGGELSQPHISKVEGGLRNASPKAIKLLASALGVPMAAILRDPEATDAGKALAS